VALLPRRDAQHAVCDAVAKEIELPACTCWPVITEAAYLLRHTPDVVRKLLACCDGSRFEILSLDQDDLTGIDAILADYQDQSLDLADAAHSQPDLLPFASSIPSVLSRTSFPPGLVSIYLLWLASPFTAVAAGYGIAILTGERIGKVVFVAVSLALFLDLCLLPVAVNMIN
jgi:hypothetical protein